MYCDAFLCSVCPTDFVYNATVNGCYKVMSVNREWSLAGLECRALHKDAHLLVISDAAEQAAVAQLIDATNGSLQPLSALFHSTSVVLLVMEKSSEKFFHF